MTKTLLKNVILFTMQGEGLGVIDDGALCFEGNLITAIGTTAKLEGLADSADRIIDGGGRKVVMPGFIDAHMHSSLSLLRGLAQDVPEEEWMHKTIFPFLPHYQDHHLIAAAKLSVLEGIRYGTTTFVDWGYPIQAPLEEVYIPLGIRVAISPAINGVDDSTETTPDVAYPFNQEKGNRIFQENIALFEKYHETHDQRVHIMFGPHAVDMIPLELLKRVAAKATELGVPYHMHVAQGGRENKQMKLRYGRPTVDLLREEGLLTEKLIAVHCHYASSEELKVMAGEGVRMVSCPSSIGIIDGWVPPLAEYLRYGGVAALGSDQASGNNNQSILAELKIAALLNKTREKDPTVLPAWQMLRLVTLDAARVIGIDHLVGSLAVGKRADLVIFNLNHPTLTPCLTYPIHNLAHNLVYASRGEEISDVVIDGKFMKESGKVIFLDETAALQQAQAAAENLMKLGGPAYLQQRSLLVKQSEAGIF